MDSQHYLPDLGMTIGEAKQLLKEGRKKGLECPVCCQHVQMYKRRLGHSIARGLIVLKRFDDRFPQRWVHIEDYFKSLVYLKSPIRADTAKLVHWGLLERFSGERDDGSKRVGYYRVTPSGHRFANMEMTVHSHVFLYNNTFQGFWGEQVNIQQCLGKKFNYNELMTESESSPEGSSETAFSEPAKKPEPSNEDIFMRPDYGTA